MVQWTRTETNGVAWCSGLVAKIAEDVEDVENLLAQRNEEHLAKQNAEFAVRQVGDAYTHV